MTARWFQTPLGGVMNDLSAARPLYIGSEQADGWTIFASSGT